MTLTMANDKAKRLSHDRIHRYVIWYPEEWDKPGEHYHICRENDFDGYYYGLSDSNIISVFYNGEYCE